MPVMVRSGAPDVDERTETKALATMAERARRAGVDVAIDVAEGSAAEAITQYADRAPVDLIVIGTHGFSGFKHVMLGSVTEKVLRHATCPVLTVPPRARATSKLPFQQLLWPTDFSAPSIASLSVACSFAEESNAVLTLLHVIDDPDEHELFVARPYDVHRHAAERERHAVEHLSNLVPDEVRDWASPNARVVRGKTDEQILRVAAEENTDLIVMGVQHRKPLDLMVSGSTTNQIVRRATCPVLTVRR